MIPETYEISMMILKESPSTTWSASEKKCLVAESDVSQRFC